MMALLRLFFILTFLATCSALAGPAKEKKKKIDVNFKPNESPVLNINRIFEPIVIDGDISDPAWQQAAQAGNFMETFPGDQTRPPVDTEVLIAYDENNLYVAFIAEDDPTAIRSSLRDRDAIYQEDFVGIMIDPYGDAATGYELLVNPIGVQADMIMNRGNEDDSFDMIFKSKGKITDKGYQVEMAIPFSSLRFPDREVQTWKVNFWRNHPRDSRRRYSWSKISRDEPCFMCQWGTMTGIENVKPGTNLEFLPSVVGSQSGALSDGDDPASGFVNDDINGEASLGVRYAFTPSVSVQATYNPDFSQVESDAAQVDVNTNFALFFPERRPFFQEGSEMFNTWVNMVYTRSINNPQFAGKLTGRSGRMSFGFISARDLDSPLILPFEEGSEFVAAGKSISNIFRMRQNFGKNSYIGAMLTDRRYEGNDGSGTGFGLDGQIRLGKTYQLEWQVVASRTQEPNDSSLTTDIDDMTFANGKYSAAFDGESYTGTASYISLENHARKWSFDIDYRHSTPEFRADNGFVFRNNTRQVNVWTGYKFYKSSFYDEFRPAIEVGRIWNFDGVRKDEWIMPRVNMSLKKQTNIFAGYLLSRELYQGIQFNDIRRVMMNLNTNFSKVFGFGYFIQYGTSIARFEEPAVLGENGLNFEFWSTIKPLQQLVIQPSFNYASLEHPESGEKLFNGYILRSRFNYQFSRAFFLRLVLQYNNFNDHVSVEPLATYRINPFTIFYLGSTLGYQNYPNHDRFSGYRSDSRQYFFKFQYLFQI